MKEQNLYIDFFLVRLILQDIVYIYLYIVYLKNL